MSLLVVVCGSAAQKTKLMVKERVVLQKFNPMDTIDVQVSRTYAARALTCPAFGPNESQQSRQHRSVMRDNLFELLAPQCHVGMLVFHQHSIIARCDAIAPNSL